MDIHPFTHRNKHHDYACFLFSKESVLKTDTILEKIKHKCWSDMTHETDGKNQTR